MKYIQGIEEFALEKEAVVTLGKFDGVHVGHQKLLEIVCRKAQEQQLLSAAFTFDRIPLRICPQRQQHFIMTNTERRSFMEALGLDVLIAFPFTEAFMDTEPEEFIQTVLIKRLRAKCVVVGPDYGFGKDRRGNARMLEEKGEEYGFETIVVEKERYQNREISSTYVREELQEGHMETVNVLLGRPYAVRGVVSLGEQLGRRLNIPTINIYPPEHKLLPPNGVYASVTLINGKAYYGVTNLGTKPTVSTKQSIGLETHLFDYADEAYGEVVEVQLVHFIRPEMKFDSVDALKKQMESDAVFAKSMFLIEN